MKKLMIAVALFLSLTAIGQKGVTYVRVGYKSLVDKKFEKIVGKEWVDFKDGSNPGMYYKVEYDYGEPPPHYHELVKSFYNHGFPDTIRGWVVDKQKEFNMDGDYPFLSFDLIQTCTNKINSHLDVYVETMSIDMGPNGFNIRIFCRDEEMERRSKIILEKYNL